MKKYTPKQLRKLSIMRLIHIILFLQSLSKSSRKHRKGRKKKGKRRSGKRRSGKHLSAGIHHVKVGKQMRKVKVLASGKWRFMKGK